MRTLGRLVSRHPWAVLLAWLLAAALSLPFAARAPAALTADPAGGLTGSEATRVTEVLRDRFGERDTNTVVLVTRSTPPLGTREGDATYQRFLDGLEDVPGVTRVTPAQSGGPYRTRSADGALALTLAQIPLLDGASDTLRLVRAYTDRAESAALDIRVTGGQAIADDFTHFAESDTKRSELVALPLIGALLLVVFGALVATGLPLAVGMLSISVAMAALYGLTHVMDVSTFAQSVITMLGLGAGIDYALLMVNRFREELNRTPDPRLAAERTVHTAGRSVTFSGLTVAIAMAGLILPPIAFVRSIGIGGVLAVLLTVLASLTALPALLALLGDRVNHPRFTRLNWAQSGAASGGWTTFARRVTARPWIAVLSSTAFLLLLASPALNIRTGYAGAWGLTPGVESRDTLKDVEALGAGGLLSQFEVILDLKGQRYTPQDRAKFQALVTDLRALPGVKGVLSPFLTPSGLAGTNGGSTDQLAALSALTTRSFSRDRTLLRVTVIPDRTLPAREIPAFERQIRDTVQASGYAYLLGGAPVGGEEFSRAITDSLLTVVLAVFAGTFLLLMVAFRSLLIPLKSILMNALTVGAAIGLVTLIVQEGVLAAPLGIPGDVGVLDASLPVLLFAVMFGLSMDYEIFLLSRVQEEYLAGHPNDEAVVLAVGHTARIITSAAIIMFIVFSAFIFGRVVASKSIGLGLAIAVALDATLVRLVLVPAFLKLAGKWNWWLPAWLDRRLPHIRLEH
ncbi:MMPL family transporter [Deinococcus soli (ex Cha et al. 2016)]|uniref:MMPL family transporter n=1 Tax=Deinococcus soli (ex Cha et al. 2016) TaxID=1309411 RepID=UPI00166A5401|nr:MMPL family transporter [Deinococcus soli (ex Cha et al. 2016)]GGB65794.1 membrane protein [Deinococcus soli (ex Cha et al. 2016)]